MASSDYKNASPDPLRDVAEDIVNQINTDNMEDIFRFCNVYVDLDFVVSIIQHVMQIVQRMFCLPNYFAFAFSVSLVIHGYHFSIYTRFRKQR